MEDARMIMEEHWLKFVLEHEGLLYQFFDYNNECSENWEFKHVMMKAAYRKDGHPKHLIVDELRKRRSRFETLRLRVLVKKRKNKKIIQSATRYTH
jgi:hypothetical protein